MLLRRSRETVLWADLPTETVGIVVKVESTRKAGQKGDLKLVVRTNDIIHIGLLDDGFIIQVISKAVVFSPRNKQI